MKNYINLENYFPYLLQTISAHIRRGTATIPLNGYQISLREWRIIAILAERDSLTSKQLCFLTGMDKASVSRAMTYLLKQNLVAQSENVKDWRSKFISLKPKGRDVYDEIAPKKLQRSEELWSNLTKKEQSQLIKLLQKLKKNVHIKLDDTSDETNV